MLKTGIFYFSINVYCLEFFMKDWYIVGLNVGNHDSSAALIKNGTIFSYIEEERVSRNKLAIGEPPVKALKCCLNQAGISLEDVEAIAVGMDWTYRNKVYGMSKEELDKYLKFENDDWFLPVSEFTANKPPIYKIKHHLAHAASAYRTSGFHKSAVLVVDNRGEDASTSLGIAENGKITFFKQINIQNSLGIFYNRACRYTGLYGKFREVGKFMGLASYGNPCYKMPLVPSRSGLLFESLPSIENKNIFESIQLRTEQLSGYFKENCFPFEAENVSDIMSYANFAASAQYALEQVLLDFVAELKEKTKLEHLVLAGGVALNCSANGKIEQSGIFKHIYIPPFASDAGTAVGAALELSNILHGGAVSQSQLQKPCLGMEFGDEHVFVVLRKFEHKLQWQVFDEDELCKTVANILSNKKIVAWMQGGFEAGPRALGYRSILADPRKRSSLIKLNEIKQREMWRPIAPSVLIEKYSDFFEGSAENKYFMNVATKVKREKQKFIPAVVHVDETARPQVVTKENKRYYNLINAFYEITGIPVLCNTSFNQKGVPLVSTPNDAIECLLNSDIDYLVIGNVLIQKKY